jgi:O-antigen/teichoic acid export membrane protein
MAWFTRDVTRTLMAHVPVVFLGLGASILTARVLGPEDRGIYALCFMILNTGIFFAALSLGQSVTYHIGRRKIAADRVLGGALLLVALLGALLLAALRLGEPVFLRYFEQLRHDAMLLVALIAPLMLINTALNDFFRGMDRLDFFNTCRILRPALRFGALAAAFALGGGLLEALQAVLLSELLVLPLQLAFLLRLCRPSFSGTRSIVGALAGFGARLEAAAAIGQVDYRVAGFVVAYFTASDQLAFFAIAEGLVTQLMALPTLVAVVLLPKIARQDDAEASWMTSAACRSTLFVVAAVALLIAAVSQPLIHLLYGSDYLPTAIVLVALLPVAIGRAGTRILTRYIVIANRLRILAFANATTLVVHVALLLILVPSGGIVGAAVATSVTYILRLAIVVGAFARLTGIPVRETLFVNRADIERLLRAGRDALSLRALRPTDGSD